MLLVVLADSTVANLRTRRNCAGFFPCTVYGSYLNEKAVLQLLHSSLGHENHVLPPPGFSFLNGFQIHAFVVH